MADDREQEDAVQKDEQGAGAATDSRKAVEPAGFVADVEEDPDPFEVVTLAKARRSGCEPVENPFEVPAKKSAEKPGLPWKNLNCSWAMMAAGVLFAVLGVLCFAWPDLQLQTEALVLGAGFLVGAVAVFVDFFTNLHRYIKWLVVCGVVNLALGAALVFNPLLGAQVIAWLIALAIAVAGVAQLFSCWKERAKVNLNWWLSLISGVVNIALGACLVVVPDTAIVWLPVFTLVYGVCLFAYAFKVVRP